MKVRNFGKLGDSSAAQLNAGTIGIQKDKVVHLDPTTEILYDPAENIRNGKVVDDSIEGLIELRLTMDGAEQLQPIRVYPLPPDKLDASKPAMKYGIAYGHRRTLSCRLTTADHPSIGPKPRKVAAVIDVDWLKRGRSYRLRCQIHENTAKVDLNPVELGQALRDYQRELGQEEKRHVSQAELMQVYGLREKTVYNLLKAADFHPVAKEVCHSHLLSDLDTMVTFDVICKLNEDLAKAIFESLKVPGAPSNRTLIRQARVLAEDESYKFDPETWIWPESVSAVVERQAGPVTTATTTTQAPSQIPGSQGSAAQSSTDGQQQSGAASQQSSGGAAQEPLSTGAQPAAQVKTGGQAEAEAPAQPQTQTGTQPVVVTDGGAGAAEQGTRADLDGVAPEANQQQASQPIIMVEFKMGEEAKKTFTGELLVSRKAKATSAGVIAYLNEEGREEVIEVPLKYIGLVSINHA
ncbi:hypothetical protein [Pseudomonas aeruginosa]|uniref:hypothetical protein n=1 Tax=Pseudomonas aeruginosa TaxID=287 RepID=UPI000EB5F0DD|nr:hypothetical protein [Pseudomonas aeruginosa]